MLYLSGAIRPQLRHKRLGWMFSPNMGNRIPDDGLWALDNGCFSNSAIDVDRFLDHAMKRLKEAGERCLFIVAPDVPFQAKETLERFAAWGQRVRNLAPVALVSQDGMHSEDIPWRDVDALFVGGSTGWKTGHESAEIVSIARRWGKWVHMGRVNSQRRLFAAQSIGCDSADGTYLKYGPDVNWPRLRSWLEAQEREPAMVLNWAT